HGGVEVLFGLGREAVWPMALDGVRSRHPVEQERGIKIAARTRDPGPSGTEPVTLPTLWFAGQGYDAEAPLVLSPVVPWRASRERCAAQRTSGDGRWAASRRAGMPSGPPMSPRSSEAK